MCFGWLLNAAMRIFHMFAVLYINFLEFGYLLKLKTGNLLHSRQRDSREFCASKRGFFIT